MVGEPHDGEVVEAARGGRNERGELREYRPGDVAIEDEPAAAVEEGDHDARDVAEIALVEKSRE
jgi:hypothetical protein